MKRFKIIVAVSKNSGLGFENTLPWKIPADLQHFKTTTIGSSELQNVVIMGRRTWESIPKKYRPLPNRRNVVISSTLIDNQCEVFSSLDEALTWTNEIPCHEVFVAGGERLYQSAINHPYCSGLIVTHIDQTYKCDTFFPEIDGNLYSISEVGQKKGKSVKHQVVKYVRTNKPHEEHQYLDLVRKIIQEGNYRMDRTEVGTKSIFGAQMKFDLSSGFPLLTTKRVFVRGIIEEILWMLSGSTDAKKLQAKNVRIWDGNTSREYLDRIGLTHLETGDCGAAYGFQFRHFGAKYIDCHTDYSGQGTDQVMNVLRLLKSDPDSRRMVINLWNPCDLDKTCLPACHCLYQFYVFDHKLSCSMYQRSADMGLGVPFNIASASIMTHIFAKISGLEVGELTHTLGDAHVYMNHVSALEQQIARTPKPWPRLKINPIKEFTQVEDFEYADFILEGYYPHEAIKMEMAV